MIAWLQWLEHSRVAAAIRDSVWLYPSIEILHIAGFVVLVGAAAMFDLRLLGVSRHLPADQVSAHLLPVSRRSAFVVVPSGLALFVSDATAMSINPAFRLKLVLIACAGINAYAFHRWCFPTVAAWRIDKPSPPRARLAAATSLLLWAAVISCGRLIAYL
jgi:hypothetical protein